MNDGVRCGIDALRADQFQMLRGRRVGLITNHTGVSQDLTPTLDLLAQSRDVLLLTLFSPEHGIRGDVDAPVEDGADAKIGLPIHSLYGARTRPTAEQLHGLDTLVYDIQDVGARFYTYITTLGKCMEAAAEQGLRLCVLDRPNPIGGFAVEGPIADAGVLDFTAYHTLPIRHGLTVGELARLFALERKIDVDLHVVAAEGWTRRMLWDRTGLTWINPSPNMRSLTEAMLYPGIGLLEFTNVSVGRGTDTPFEHIGAPWIRQRELGAWLNDSGLPGVRFVPVRFTPRSSTHAQSVCGGVQFAITDWSRFQPVLTGLTVAQGLRRLFPNDWQHERYIRLLANRSAYDAIVAGQTAASVVAAHRPDVDQFRRRREPILLYPDR